MICADGTSMHNRPPLPPPLSLSPCTNREGRVGGSNIRFPPRGVSRHISTLCAKPHCERYCKWVLEERRKCEGAGATR
jgi:hypothetical protein